MAVDMVREKLITEREALLRIDPEQLNFFLHDMVDPDAMKPDPLCSGLPASPGCATGKIVFDCKEAEAMKLSGQSVILVRDQTSADDIGGMYASAGILTMHGGMTSHAAVVARGMGRVAVTGVAGEGLVRIDEKAQRLVRQDGSFLSKGDVITLDGSGGIVYPGIVPTVSAAYDKDYQTVLQWADKYKRMGVFANAETADDMQKAAELGAEGVGLCRTEHMFFRLPERINAMRAMVLSKSPEERQKHLDSMLTFQQIDFLDIFRKFPGKIVTVRYLDPPLHEFLPEEGESFARDIDELARVLGVSVEECRARIITHKEKNPSKSRLRITGVNS